MLETIIVIQILVSVFLFLLCKRQRRKVRLLDEIRVCSAAIIKVHEEEEEEEYKGMIANLENLNKAQDKLIAAYKRREDSVQTLIGLCETLTDKQEKDGDNIETGGLPPKDKGAAEAALPVEQVDADGREQ